MGWTREQPEVNSTGGKLRTKDRCDTSDNGQRTSADPMLDWMIGDVYSEKDSEDNVYPRKIGNENKIDGAVASIMALGWDMVSAAGEQSAAIEIW